jgi:hypothetical protein
MYLLVWIDGSAKQVTENLTSVDLLGVQVGTLSIFRHNQDRGRFEKLVFDRGTSAWVPIPDAKVLSGPSARIHI